MSVTKLPTDSQVDWKSSPRLAAAWQQGDRWGMEQHGQELGPFATWLAARMDQTPRYKSVLEIGYRRGGTLAFWHTLFNGYTCGLDSEEFAPSRATKLEEEYPGVTCYVIDSHDPHAVILAKVWGGVYGIDFLFLDGDHSPEGIAQDYADYAPLVRPGGVIALHDITDTPENRALQMGTMDFWQGLGGEKYEWIYGAPWGGIGAQVKA